MRSNYAASLKAQEEAHEKGYEQILWLDGVQRKYVEEIGTFDYFIMRILPLSGQMF